MKPPTAQDYLLSKIKDLNITSVFITNKMPTVKAILIEFAKLHVDAALEEAYKNSKVIVDNFSFLDWVCPPRVSKESILNSYPESNIV